jgi:DNA-binding NarL/FixJ family response regulator
MRVVVLTTFDDEATVFGALRAGASGTVAGGPGRGRAATRCSPQRDPGGPAAGSVRQVRRMLGGGRPGVWRAAPPGLATLTEREREVVGLVAIGLSNDEIARKLVVSPLTAKTHVSRAMKLDARDRAQLVGHGL